MRAPCCNCSHTRLSLFKVIQTHQHVGIWISFPYRAVLKEGMTGMRGRKLPALSWHVRPAWNPKTCKKREMEEGVGIQGGQEERLKEMARERETQN